LVEHDLFAKPVSTFPDHGLAPAGATEMGVAEGGRIFEAVAECAVEADMRAIKMSPAAVSAGRLPKNPASVSDSANT
jgi:hypothetical protein